MGYTIELEGDDLLCKSQADAVEAAGLINGSLWMSPYHLQVEADEIGTGDMKGTWYLCVEHFQGDHWNDDDARLVWLSIAPHMADGATIEFQGEGRERWRIRWQWDDCEVCRGQT